MVRDADGVIGVTLAGDCRVSSHILSVLYQIFYDLSGAWHQPAYWTAAAGNVFHPAVCIDGSGSAAVQRLSPESRIQPAMVVGRDDALFDLIPGDLRALGTGVHVGRWLDISISVIDDNLADESLAMAGRGLFHARLFREGADASLLPGSCPRN